MGRRIHREEVPFSARHTEPHRISTCHLIIDVYLDHLVRVISARFRAALLTMLPFPYCVLSDTGPDHTPREGNSPSTPTRLICDLSGPMTPAQTPPTQSLWG